MRRVVVDKDVVKEVRMCLSWNADQNTLRVITELAETRDEARVTPTGRMLIMTPGTTLSLECCAMMGAGEVGKPKKWDGEKEGTAYVGDVAGWKRDPGPVLTSVRGRPCRARDTGSRAPALTPSKPHRNPQRPTTLK